MKKIILDTNFLMIPYMFKVDIMSEIRRIMDEPYKLFILDKTNDELENIILTQSGKDKDASKFAKSFLAVNEILEIKSDEEHVDHGILEIVDEDTIVCTQDSDLKQKLKIKGVKTIVLRQKSHLEFS